MSAVNRDAPIGVQCLQRISGRLCPRWQPNRLRLYQGSILVLTYITYMTYHLTRKPISVVKSVLHRNCSELVPPPGEDPHDDQWCNWPPFNTPDANTLLGALDSAFLFSYAAAMFVSGMVAERVDLRYFLAIGMTTSAIFCYLFGLGHTLGIHSIGYYLLIQVGFGIAQTSGWPGTVAAVGNWFGNTKKGLIFGIWNSHTSLGNIFGSQFETKQTFDQRTPPHFQYNSEEANESTALLSSGGTRASSAVSLTRAAAIPGVMEFSFSLFFAKLVSYTFLYWLPMYINSSTKLTPKQSGDLSTVFDVGGIIGGVAAGLLADWGGSPALVCLGFYALAAPALFIYQLYGAVSYAHNVCLLVLGGALVNGPYALITTAVAAELGGRGAAPALATVTALIDGTGSLGAALGPMLAGVVSSSGTWSHVFYMLITCDLIALLLLLRLGKSELVKLRQERRISSQRVVRIE